MARSVRGGGAGASEDALAQVRRDLRERLLQRVDARASRLRGGPSAACASARRRSRSSARRATFRQRDLARLNEVSDEVVGFGPIEFLLKDPEVTEVT